MSKLTDPRQASMTLAYENLARRVLELERRSAWTATGAHPNGLDGIDSDNYVPGVSGFRLAETPEFNDLQLRGGIIGNAALENPVVPQYVYDYTSGFGLSTTIAHVRRTTITVPADVTSAIVSVSARIYAINNTAWLDYLYCQANIAGFNGLALPVAASGSNGSALNVSPFATTLSGLTPGATFTIDIDGLTAFGAWGANASNQADVAGTILWFR